MALGIGPVRLGMIAAGRSVAPTVYTNPLGEGSLISWIANPNNDYLVTSLVLCVFIAASSVWLMQGVVAFAKTESISFAIALLIGLGLALALVEGNKFDPLDLDQMLFALLVMLTYLSATGRMIAQNADKETAGEKT